MRSLIIIEVEHGEDTDSIQEFAEVVSETRMDGSQWLENFGFEFKVLDTAVRVDLPECFILDNPYDLD